MTHIRKAQPEDVKAIHALGGMVPEFSVNKETVTFWPQDILARAVGSSDTLVLVAEADGQVVGFIIASLNGSLRKAIIENVYVRPDNRGAGTGGKLLDALLAALDGTPIEYVCTLVPIDADGASRLYAEAGFTAGESFVWLDKSLSNTFSKL